jgi:hypothetical protein
VTKPASVTPDIASSANGELPGKTMLAKTLATVHPLADLAGNGV